MRKLCSLALALGLVAATSSCAYIGGGTDLSDVADENGMINVTTGDGTFENYTATGHHTGTEIGIGLGLPMLKLLELYPAASNEDLLSDVAGSASADGANAMINVTPHKSFFMGFIIGLYIDSAQGTGISTN